MSMRMDPLGISKIFSASHIYSNISISMYDTKYEEGGNKTENAGFTFRRRFNGPVRRDLRGAMRLCRVTS